MCHAASFFLGFLLLSGCKTSFITPHIALRELSMEASVKANDVSPVAVELVAIQDEELAKKLLSLTAGQWFDPAANWKIDYPKVLQTWYYEITPGQRIVLSPTEFSGRSGYALLLFANYKGSGVYRLRLDSFQKASVMFMEKDVKLQVIP